MISWLQTVIQRNHKILFSVLLIVIIIAFVFTIGDFGGIGPGSRADRLAEQKFYGYDLNNSRTAEELSRWTNISLQLNQQQQPSQEQYTLVVLQRIIGLHLADQFQIPTPSGPEFSSYMKRVPAFLDPQTGAFSPNRLQEVIDLFNTNPQMGEALLTLVLVQDYRIDKAMELVGGPGYVLPQFAETTLQARKTEWTLEIANLSRAEFKPTIDLSDEAIAQYYEANKERYKPENDILAGYAFFPTAAYAGTIATPTQQQLETYYQAQLGNWPKNDSGQAKPLADIRADVVAAWQQSEAAAKAETAANQLTLVIYNAASNGKLQADPASVAAFLEAEGQKLVDLPAFNSASLSQSDAAQLQIKQRVLGLRGQDRFFSDAIQLEDGAALAFLFDEQEQPIPQLADIRQQVVADTTAEQNLRAFAEKTQSIRGELETALADAKSFEEAAQALGLSVQKIPAFTPENPPQDINPYILFSALDLQQGDVSQPLTDAQGSSLVYVAERKTPQAKVNAEELEQAISWLQPAMQRATAGSVIADLLDAAELANAQGAAY